MKPAQFSVGDIIYLRDFHAYTCTVEGFEGLFVKVRCADGSLTYATARRLYTTLHGAQTGRE